MNPPANPPQKLAFIFEMAQQYNEVELMLQI